MVKNNCFFNTVEELIAYIRTNFPEKSQLSPIKLQKILYFMFAYYGANIGSITQTDVDNSDMNKTYPKYLFPEPFEAWKYGPVIRDVYSTNKKHGYDDLDEFDPTEYDPEVLDYLDDLFIQLEAINDFSLVQRSHLDKAWIEKYDKNNPYKSEEMDKDQIIEEYIVE